MELALWIYVICRLLCGGGNNEPCNVEPVKTVEEHAYVETRFSDEPGFSILGSEMLSQYVIHTDLTAEEKNKLEKESTLYQQIEKTPVRTSVISRKILKKMNGSCRYLRTSAQLYNDRFNESRPLIVIHNGVYFVIETKGQWAKILLPVKGGYVAYYMPASHLTEKIEEAQDYKHTAGCMDTMTPEKCASCWPHEHHRPILVQ